MNKYKYKSKTLLFDSEMQSPMFGWNNQTKAMPVNQTYKSTCQLHNVHWLSWQHKAKQHHGLWWWNQKVDK
jgi:hypothetical protein